MTTAETANQIETAAVAHPGGLGAIRVSGPDAKNFLDAQLTNRLPGAGDGRSALAAWCDAKGRTLAVLRVLPNTEGGFLLVLPEVLIESILKRLRMYVLRSRVELDGGATATLGLLGARAQALLGEALALPDEPDGLWLAENLAVTRMPGPETRFLVAGPPDAVDALASGFPGPRAPDPVTNDRWRLADIRAGLPQIYPATQGLFVPQMLNLHRLGGVDFQKGCYPGQEVVARLQYRGKLKRCLYRAALPGPAPAPGEDIVDADGVREGTVIEAADRPDGGSELLAVIRIEAANKELSVDDRSCQLSAISLQ